MKRIVSLILALCMAFSFSSIAFAADSNTTDDVSISAPVLQGTGKPNLQWDWSQGQYNFSGSSSFSPLYSNYYFSGASEVNITVKNNHASKKLTVKLLHSALGVDKAVSEEDIAPGQRKEWSVAITPKENYIIKFSAPSNFSGSIQKTK